MRYTGILLLLLAGCTGCGGANPGIPDNGNAVPTHIDVIDPELLHYVQEFVVDCPEAVPESLHRLEWVTPDANWDPNVMGYCIPVAGEIVLDEQYKSSPPIIQRLLIYHELGHCIAGLEHVDKGYEIMSPELDINAPAYYTRAWNSLVYNMCSGRRIP